MLRPTDHPAARHVAGLSVALAAAAAAIAALLTGGCGSDSKTTAPALPAPGSTTFVGILTNTTQTGRLTVVISTASLAAPIRVERAGHYLASRSAAAVGATGTLDFGSTPLELTGTYNQASDSLNLSGGGYTLEGVVDLSGPRPSLKGAYGGPQGTGGFGCARGTYATVQFYCGTYMNDSTTMHGVFHFTVSDTTLVGIAFPDSSATGTAFGGFLRDAGDSLDVSIEVLVEGDHHMTGSGKLAKDTHEVRGTWADYDYFSMHTETGTFNALPCP